MHKKKTVGQIITNSEVVRFHYNLQLFINTRQDDKMYVRRNGVYIGSVKIINEIYKMPGSVYFVSKEKIAEPLAYKKIF
jgi:hypothetical protein